MDRPAKREHRYRLRVEWTGDEGTGTSGYRAYRRDHVIDAPGKAAAIAGSSDPAFRGDPARYNPEELLLAAVSTCHMLWVLHLSAGAGIVVTGYTDQPEATMVEDASGGGRFAGARLRPRVRITDPTRVADAVALHERAHELCFIANSVSFPIICEPEVTVTAIGADG